MRAGVDGAPGQGTGPAGKGRRGLRERLAESWPDGFTAGYGGRAAPAVFLLQSVRLVSPVAVTGQHTAPTGPCDIDTRETTGGQFPGGGREQRASEPERRVDSAHLPGGQGG